MQISQYSSSRNITRLFSNFLFPILVALLCKVDISYSLGPSTIQTSRFLESNRKGPPDQETRPASSSSKSSRILAHRVVTPLRGTSNYIEYQPCDKVYTDVTPCEDASRARRFDRTQLFFRERHCPAPEEQLNCLIPPPPGYRSPVPWPQSRNEIWFVNVPNTNLLNHKKLFSWINYNQTTQRFVFPGGGTQFVNGAPRYIDLLNSYIPLSDGTIRTALDLGCGVASWGGFLLDKGVLTMSIAPRDFFDSQVQFALERGIPAMLGVVATKRLPYPARAFDLIHCSQCNIPWTEEEGMYLLEVDRLLRPGGYFLVAGPPTNYLKHCKNWFESASQCKEEYETMDYYLRSLYWKRVADWKKGQIWQKPFKRKFFNRKNRKQFPLCAYDDNPDDAWYTGMKACISRDPEPLDNQMNENVFHDSSRLDADQDESSAENTINREDAESLESKGNTESDKENVGEVDKWPRRLNAIPPRVMHDMVWNLNTEKYIEDQKMWQSRVAFYKSHVLPFLAEGKYRNIIDMNAQLGSFAATLVNDPVWVMNVVLSFSDKHHLGIVYERGLIGTYHDWCESFSTYPRTYDFIHAYNVFSAIRNRCSMDSLLLEMDRILRPEGAAIIRDKVAILEIIKEKIKGIRWDGKISDIAADDVPDEKILVCVKKYWTS